MIDMVIMYNAKLDLVCVNVYFDLDTRLYPTQLKISM